MTELQKKLTSIKDEKFRKFNASLLPTLDKSRVLGIKTPVLRALAKEMIKNGSAEGFLLELPHEYFEEDQIHAFIINEEKDIDLLLSKLDDFLPYVNNWATCDQMTAKALGKDKEKLLSSIEKWLSSGDTYTVRFGIGKLMQFFLDSDFKPEYLERVAEIKSNEYYINMMQAWFFATSLAKQYESTLPYIKDDRLSPQVHNKTIQKAKESFRVSDEHKKELEKFKIKGDKYAENI